MRPKAYTFFIASSHRGSVRKVRVPFYVLHLLMLLAIVGGATVLAAVGSYTRMMWKVGNYNSLRREQDALKRQYEQLQTTVKDTNQRLSSLQSLPPDPVRPRRKRRGWGLSRGGSCLREVGRAVPFLESEPHGRGTANRGIAFDAAPGLRRCQI